MPPEAVSFVLMVVGAIASLGATLLYAQWQTAPGMRVQHRSAAKRPAAAWRGRSSVPAGG